MARGSLTALLAGASLLTLALTTGGALARGGGHFGGGHFGGGHFGGREVRPEFRPEFRPEERIDRPHIEEREHSIEHEEHRGGDEHRANEDRREDRDRDLAREHDDHRPDAAKDAARDAARDRDLRRAGAAAGLAAGLHGHWDRNAFFNPHFAARDFHCYAGCRWGWAGAVFWPFALGDIFSFAWWPYAGVPAFWNYGVDTVLTGLFWPYGIYEWPDDTYGAYVWNSNGQYQVARETHQDLYSTGPQDDASSVQDSTTGTSAVETCSGFAPGVGILPIDQIKAAVKPTASQEASFEALEAASTKAVAILKASCPNDPPLTPVGRLDALQKRLNGMKQAIETVQGPLVAFSGKLTSDQEKALNALGGSEGKPSSDMEMGDLSRCIDEGEEFNGVPAQRIASAVRPNDNQKAQLNKLEMVTEQKAEWLRSQCPGSVPATAQARLEAMDQRIDETIAAVNAVRPALVAFYDSLSDEQKAHFNTLPSEAAAERP